MFRIALISRWHAHSQKPDERYLNEFLTCPDCQVVCVWDKDPEIARQWASEHGVEAETDLYKVLDREDVDGILVTSAPDDHVEIMVAAAQRKKHIFTEKVLAKTLEEAEIIRKAVKENGVKFCISFQRQAIKQLAYAKKLVQDGTLGPPVNYRCMCGHNMGITGALPDYWFDPAIAGGGAMIDLGFNSAYLARYIMGDMESVSSSFNYDIMHKQVEDNATCVVKFKNGATGVIEATFTSPLLSVFELGVYGTKGAYYARFGGADCAELRLAGEANRVIPLEEVPESIQTPMRTWVSACTKGTSDEDYGIDAAVEMVKYMIAAYQSHADGGKITAL